MIGENSEKNKKFEITLVVRDKEGNPTGHRKTLSSDSPDRIAGFVNGGSRKKRGRKKKNTNNT